MFKQHQAPTPTLRPKKIEGGGWRIDKRKLRMEGRLASTIFHLLIISLGGLLFGVRDVAASASFTSSYNVTYDFAENGSAQVAQQITLINQTPDRYPANYTLTLKGLKPQNIKASDELGALKTNLSWDEKENLSKIKVHFNKKALGQGARFHWRLSFEVPGLAKKNGRLREMAIPLLSSQESIDNYQLTIAVPPSYGLLHYFKPAQIQEIEERDRKRIYQFKAADNLAVSGLALSFGDFQLYNFKLTFHLYNPTGQRVLTEIALPPDFYPYQRVYFSSIDPKPAGISQDADGNYLAAYKLKPKQKLDVVYQGQIKIAAVSRLSNPQFPTLPAQANPNPQPYLLPAKFWEVNDEKIQAAKSKIQNDYQLGLQSSQNDWARAIYKFVTTTLHYNPDRIAPEIERFGAVRALQDSQDAVCMEYTDLLITLLRSAGIAAREVDGFAMTQNDPDKPTLSDTLHAWVQFFDQEANLWRSVDPTWGSTTQQDYFSQLDANHIIFVFKGLDSEHPYPAGSYKITGNEQGDVQVEYAQQFKSSVLPFRLWWQQQFETKPVSIFDKMFLWLSNLIH